MDDFLSDIRYAVRVLWKSPAFTLVALLTLTLGIGTNVVVFGIFNAVLLHPLEVSDPENLYQIRFRPWTSFKLLTTSYPAFDDYRERNTTFSAIAGYYGYSNARLRSGNSVLNVSGYAVTGNYFDMLGVQPQLGRFIQPTDEHGPNSVPYIVLSDSLWRRAFNADPGIIGKTVQLYKAPYTVIGVAPPRFHGTEQFVWPDYWISVLNYFGKDYLEDRTGRPLVVLGRLKPTVTPEQAAENLSAIAGELAREYPRTDTGMPLRLVRPGLYADNGDVIRASLYSVSGLAFLVLLAACANLASLFAARAADRGHELAVRVALGASRWRLVRQLLTEAMVLSTIGGVAGLAMGGLLLELLNRGGTPGFMGGSPYTHVAISVDARVYLTSIVLIVVSGVLFGIIPARQAGRSRPLPAMKSASTNATLCRRLGIRDILLGFQIVICTLLIIASLVAVRGMIRMLHLPLGFQAQGAMLAEMDLDEVGGDLPLEKTKTIIDALRNIPGVIGVGTLSKPPFTGGIRGIPVFPPGTTDFSLHNSVLAPYRFTISPGYFDMARTRLLRGRDFSWSDSSTTPYVAIVNETFARKMWGDAPAIGQRFIFMERLREVVGVVEDGKYHEIDEPFQPAIYVPLPQSEQTYPYFLVRSHRSYDDTGRAIQATLNSFEPNAPVTVENWSESVDAQLYSARVAALTLGAMGGLGAMLALTGIFGMATYNVSRRMKELGIRVALGARARHVVKAAVGRPILLLGAGSVAGLLLGMFTGKLLAQIVYQANPRDPLIMGIAIVTMMLLGVFASVVPALRALAVDPSKLLRTE